VRARILDNNVPLNQVLGRWKINNGRVVFYFELAEVGQQGQSLGDGDLACHECKPQDAGRSEAAPQLTKGSSLSPEFVGKFVSGKVTVRKLLAEQDEDPGSNTLSLTQFPGQLEIV
jgi:hypothetical protein